MHRFFVPDGAVDGDRVTIAGADAAHLSRSLRAQRGELIVVVDERATEHGVLLTEVSGDAVRGRRTWSRPATGEPALRVHVLQALPKEGMDGVVEALAQLGVAAVHPLITERTVARPDARRAAGRLERWRAVARAAAGLAGRGEPPAIHPVGDLAAALRRLPRPARLVACAVDGGAAPLARIAVEPATPLALCVGPEGGLGPRDLAALDAAGAERAHLGPRVVRSRLAATVAVALALARAGELDSAVAPAPAAAAAR